MRQAPIAKKAHQAILAELLLDSLHPLDQIDSTSAPEELITVILRNLVAFLAKLGDIAKILAQSNQWSVQQDITAHHTIVLEVKVYTIRYSNAQQVHIAV